MAHRYNTDKFGNIELEATVKGLGNIYLSNHMVPFMKGTEIIGLRDLAYARIKQGKESPLYSASLVKEGSILLPNERKCEGIEGLEKPIILLTSRSPCWNLGETRGVRDCHFDPVRKDDELHYYEEFESCYLKPEKAKEYLDKAEMDKKKAPQERDVFILNTEKRKGSDVCFRIPTNRFGEEELTLWAFKDMAEDYGLFLKESGINEMPVYINDEDYLKVQGHNFARPLALFSKKHLSAIDTGLRHTCECIQTHRLLWRETDQAQKKSPCTIEELEDILTTIEAVETGDLGISELKNIRGFLFNLIYLENLRELDINSPGIADTHKILY